jgi:hypothetical protein
MRSNQSLLLRVVKRDSCGCFGHASQPHAPRRRQRQYARQPMNSAQAAISAMTVMVWVMVCP